MANKKNRKGSTSNGSRKSAKPVRANVLANNQDPRPLRARRQRQASGRAPKPHHVRAICSITDPFCPAAKNAKWPDGTSGNTLTEQFRGNASITVDAAGNELYCFAAAAPFGYVGSTVVAGPPIVGTTDANYNSYKANSMLATYGSGYRVVSFGIIFRCIASATTASGVITLGTAPNASGSTAYTLGQELYSEVVVKAIQPGMEICWISQPMGTGARDFVSQSTATANLTTDWTACWMEITGAAASSTPIVAEWFMNIEFQPLTTARALTAIARPNPSKSNAAEQAVSGSHTTLGSFIEGGVKSAEQAVAKAATDALTAFSNDPLESIASLFAMF